MAFQSGSKETQPDETKALRKALLPISRHLTPHSVPFAGRRLGIASEAHGEASRQSPQWNINKIKDVQNTNHAPATNFAFVHSDDIGLRHQPTAAALPYSAPRRA